MPILKTPEAVDLAEESEMIDCTLMQRKKLVIEEVGSRGRSF